VDCANHTNPPCIVIAGPTAGGKTELAIELANRLPPDGELGGECICADSMQIYRGMDIGTAKPTAEEQQRAPHHLLDVLDPSEDGFTVDTWLRLAHKTMRHIADRGRVPIVVGGTNLYIQALLEGLFEGPEPDDAVRERLQATPQDELHARLTDVDPDSAERIHRNDRKRTVRAMEVFELTGTPISELQRQWNRDRPKDDIFLIGLDYSVDAINRRINRRVKTMFEQGFRNEVQQLYDAGRLGVQAAEALGYKQMIAAFRGDMSEDEAFEQIKIQTRRYARKQRTWLKRFRRHRPAAWISADEYVAQDIANYVLTSISPWLTTLAPGDRASEADG